MLSSLQSQGYNFVAGDVITAKAADSIGLNHAMITSGRESVSKALEQAKKMYGQLSYLREERNFYKKLIANEAVRIDVFDEAGISFSPMTKRRCLTELKPILTSSATRIRLI